MERAMVERVGQNWSLRVGLLVLGALVYFSLTFIWFSLPAYLGPIMDELELSGTQAGVLAGAVPLMYIPLAVISGLIVDRVGARIGITVAMILFGSAQIFRGFAPDFWSMLLFTLVIGIGATGITFSLPKLVAELFDDDWIGTASSVYLVGAAMGSATVFGVGRPLIGPFLGGWRELFFTSGVVVLGFVLIWAVASVITFHRGVIGRTAAAGNQSTFSFTSIRRDLHAVLSNRQMVLLVIIGTMYLFISHGLKGWLVTVFEVRGIPPEVGGPITSILVLAQVFGVLLIPFFADRISGSRVAVMLAGLLCFLGPVVLIGAESVAIIAIIAVIIVGFGIGGLSPLIRAIPSKLPTVGPRLTATAVGLIFAVGEIGGFLGPVIVGVIFDSTGSFTGGLLLFAVGGILVIIAGSLLTVE